MAKWADAQDLKSCGGSPSVWIRLPPRALLKARHLQGDREIERLLPSLAGSLWAPRVGPRCDGGGPDFFPREVLNRPPAPTTWN